MIKKIRYLIAVLFITLFSFQQSGAQKLTYSTRGGISLGFGIGGVYQQSDIANSRGVGYDITIGTPLYKREGAFLAADWKFRFLAGENKAYDHRVNTDGTFSNIDYKFMSYDLELGLILNRLRERTRIVVSGFAGAGITHGRTFTDLYDSDNSLYDYNVIDLNNNRKQIYEDLVDLSDDDFETSLVNKASLLPTAGLYIGYQFTPSFSLGIEHKTNFSLTEENSFTGIDMDNRINSGSTIDMNHYTTLGFVWKLGSISGGGQRTERYMMPETPDVLMEPVEPVTQNPSESPARSRVPGPPTVIINSPGSDPYFTSTGLVLIKATIRNVASPDDIVFYQEDAGLSDFSYNEYSNVFTTRAELREGENRFRISARNEAGNSEDQVVVIYERRDPVSRPMVTQSDPVPPLPAPPPSGGQIVVTQNDPPPPPPSRTTVVVTTPVPAPAEAPCVSPVIRVSTSDQVSTRNKSYVFTAGVDNITDRSQVRLILNGKDVRFDFRDNTISYQARLNPGANRFTVNAINDCGRDSRSVTVNADLNNSEPCESPVIDVSITPVNSADASHELKGKIQNIENKSEITIMVNGKSTNDFYFTPSTGAISARFQFSSRSNTVSVSTGNNCGYDTRNLSVEVEEPCREPDINIYLDAVNRPDGTHELKGIVKNIDSKSNITLKVNGRVSQNFYFVPSTGEISAKFKFNPGPAKVELSAGNDCGYDIKNLDIEVTEPCIEPTIQVSLNPSDNPRASHDLRGTIRNIDSKENITLRVNGKSNRDFRFDPESGTISALFNFTTGINTVDVSVGNDCGYDSKSLSAVVEEPVVEEVNNCGTRINPGNSDWQFCLVTPRSNYNRSNLENKSFSYSGSASSLFILPTAGGGNAIVGGKVYNLKSGQYYLFTGRLKVTVSSNQSGSMGQWWVCVESDSAPVSGNGNRRPKSPCER